MTTLELRDYQLEALERIETAEARGVRRQLLVAATGLGKTIMFVALAQRRGTRALILAHRDELVNQAVASVREWWPDVDVGIVKAEENDVRHHVVVASVQTLARERRMQQLLAPITGDSLLANAEPFGLVIVDEAHHAKADSYKAILDALRAGAPAGEDPEFGEPYPAGPLLIGVTATPDRGDGRGLDDMFDEIVVNYDLLWGIAHGYLSELRGLRIKARTLDLSKVRISKGDYDQGQAGRAMIAAHVDHVIYEAWLEHAKDRRTIVFTPTVEVAQDVAAFFTDRGVAAAMVHGRTPRDERRRILRAYSAGEIQVVANCAVLTEGYDEPRTDCIVMARPTKSRSLYTQCVGRGSRKHPDKDDCLILDIVGATEIHSLITVPSLFGLEGKQAERMSTGEATISDAVHEFQVEQVRLGQLRAEEAELFHKVRQSKIAWVPIHAPGSKLRRYIRPMPPRVQGGPAEPTVVLGQRDADTWTAALQRADNKWRVLIADVSMETAQGVAEDWIRKAGAQALTDVDAAWRKGKPTAKALGAAKKWRLTVDPSWNAGELSDAMNAHIARIKARNQRRAKTKESA